MQRPYGGATRVNQISRAFRPWGFSLVELMVTIAVAAIVLSIATPSFTSIINSNRLSSAANEMVAAIQIARTEAVRLNRSITVCSSANGLDCTGAGSWVVLDGAKLLRVSSFNAKVKSSAAIDQFIFRADGLARQTAASGLLNSDFQFCIDTTSPAQNLRTVSIGSGSRISTTPGTNTCQ